MYCNRASSHMFRLRWPLLRVVQLTVSFQGVMAFMFVL